MKRIKFCIIVIGAFIVLVPACHKDSTSSDELLYQIISSSGHEPESFILPDSDDLQAIPQDPRNPLTPEKNALGKLLFHDPSFALAPISPLNEGTYSCATCHIAGAGFKAGLPQGIGEGGLGFGFQGETRHKDPNFNGVPDVQPIRSPTIVNSAFVRNHLWDGRLGSKGANTGTAHLWDDFPEVLNRLGYEGVETQALAGITVHRMDVSPAIVEDLGYKALFDAAFPFIPENQRYTKITAALAIAAYERTVMANQAPFQNWLKGDKAALTEEQKAGARLFFGKANCVSCHYGPALTDNDFHALGTLNLHENKDVGPIFKRDPSAPQNLGRGAFTNNPEDFHKFKTPTLYNLDGFAFHGSQSKSKRETVEYFNQGLPANPLVPTSLISPDFKPLGLSPKEVDALVAFLYEGLTDPNLERYVPVELPGGGCFPNADPISLRQLGCE